MALVLSKLGEDGCRAPTRIKFMRRASILSCFNIYTLNALSFLRAYKDPGYRNIIEKGNMLLADGVGAAWGYKMLLGLRPERIAGIDFIDELCNLCVNHNQSIYCIGSRPGVVDCAIKRLKERFPGLIIAGSYHGYWPKTKENNVINLINQSGAAILLLALGQPAQEIFLDQYQARLKVSVAMGVGGSFDVIAGELKRAPKWIQQIGLEWLVRVFQEPKRITGLLRLPRFIWLVWRAKIRG